MTRDDVIDVLTAVAAADRRTVGEADVTIWGAVISDDTRVTKDEALRAIVEHFRERPGVWLEPGHIVERVRAARRDRLEREPDQFREARQEALAAKVAERVAELAAPFDATTAAMTFTRPTKRGQVNPRAVRCPWCKSGVGSACMTPGTNHVLRKYHPSRREAAEARVAQ